MSDLKCKICFKIVSEAQKDFINLAGCNDLFHTNCLLKFAEKNETGQDFNCCPDCRKPYDISLIKKTTEEYAECEVMCCIDHEQYTDARPPYSLPCNHFYHLDCLNGWRKKCEDMPQLKNQMNLCPLCKKNYEEKDILIRPLILEKIKNYRESDNKAVQEDNIRQSVVPKKEEFISILIKDLVGITSQMNVKPSWTMTEFSDAVSLAYNIPSEQLRFTFNGKGVSTQSCPEKKLSELRVNKNAIFYVLMRLKGGGGVGL